jgi:hypothetical protein
MAYPLVARFTMPEPELPSYIMHETCKSFCEAVMNLPPDYHVTPEEMARAMRDLGVTPGILEVDSMRGQEA